MEQEAGPYDFQGSPFSPPCHNGEAPVNSMGFWNPVDEDIYPALWRGIMNGYNHELLNPMYRVQMEWPHGRATAHSIANVPTYLAYVRTYVP